MKRIVAATLAAFALALVPAAQAGAQTTVASPDVEFMLEAAHGGLAEVELGHLASQRATSDAVRRFGERMVADHGAANQELFLLAQRKGVTLPRMLDREHRMVFERLAAMSGPEFDRAYMTEMMRDHQGDAVAFEREAGNGQDGDVRAWATRTLATVRQHQRYANDLHAQLAQAPILVVPAPAASPATLETVTTVTTTVVPVPPYCGGTYRADTGTNFGTCP